MPTLASLPLGQHAVVAELTCPDVALAQKLMAMGVLPGATVCVERKAPLGDPLAVRVRGTLLSLRASDAGYIKVEEA